MGNDYSFLWGVALGIVGAISTAVVAVFRLVARLSKLEHEMIEVKSDQADAKSARVEAARNMEAVKAELYDVAGNVQYIRGLLQKAVDDKDK